MIPKTWILLIILLAATMAFSRFKASPAQAQVTAGTINVGFPGDFPTARQSIPPYAGYPYVYYNSQSGIPYLLAGEPTPMNVGFYGYLSYPNNTGAGTIALIASSDAFVQNASSTMNLEQTGITLAFTLTPTIKSGLDGTYSVTCTAINELSVQVTQQSLSITVWSNSHEEASDSLFTASSMFSAYPSGLISLGTRYQTAGGEANLTLASYEYAQAVVAYNSKDWNGTITHAQNATGLINEADAAEAASSLQGKIAYLVQIGTYPLLIIAVLFIIYIAAATYRRIYPSTKPPKTV